VPISGDVITVQLRPVAGNVGEVQLLVQRNGSTESKFLLSELQQVLAVINQQMASAIHHTLNAPPK
jgi:hypothetical protein